MNKTVRDTAPAFIHEIIGLQARHKPDAAALWWQGQAISYSTLQQRLSAVAGRLAHSGQATDRVALLAWNCPEFIELIYGVPAAGRVLVPLNVRLAPPELIYQLQSSGARTLFGDPVLLRALLAHPDFPSEIEVISLGPEYEHWRDEHPLSPLPATVSDDPVWILFTSGSTGRPKGAVLTHGSFLAGLESAALGRPVDANDRYYYPFPLFHVAAHNVMLQHRHGAAVVLARSFDATETLAACKDLQITTLSLAPTMIAMLLDHPDFTVQHLDSVRTIGYGASAMPRTLLQRLLSETGVGLCQSYGMTELSGSIAFLTVEDHRLAARDNPNLLESVGRVLPTAQVKLLHDSGRECDPGEAGEILVRAAQCMIHYWDDPEATSAALIDGWLHTGDIGRLDSQGYLYIVDRKKDMIISGGENIASKEVEEVLRQHPAVRDCAVIGLPHKQWGECACAVLDLVQAVEDSELSAFCRTSLAGYKTPRRWFRVDALPLNASGKIDKPLLRKTYRSSD